MIERLFSEEGGEIRGLLPHPLLSILVLSLTPNPRISSTPQHRSGRDLERLFFPILPRGLDDGKAIFSSPCFTI